MSDTRDELTDLLLKQIKYLEKENKTAMETIGRMTIRISELEGISLIEDTSSGLRELDEIRRLKREDKKKKKCTESSLPKPLFERQFTDCGDFHYIERHPEAPEGLRDILLNQSGRAL